MTGSWRPLLHGAWRVWQRNRDVYLVTWRTNLIPPLTEPFLYLVAFGAGVGGLIQEIRYGGEAVPYAAFIAPGLMASGLLFHTFSENTYGTFVRLYYQKTFEAILTTPVGITDLIAGELLWGATKGAAANLLMMAVIALFGLIDPAAALWIVPFSLLAGLMFAAIAICFAATAARIDTLNFPTFLFVTPMFLFSGVFFPLESMPPWARGVAQLLPLTHVVHFMREASLGRRAGPLLLDLGVVVLFTAPALLIGMRLMRRRLVA